MGHEAVGTGIVAGDGTEGLNILGGEGLAGGRGCHVRSCLIDTSIRRQVRYGAPGNREGRCGPIDVRLSESRCRNST